MGNMTFRIKAVYHRLALIIFAFLFLSCAPSPYIRNTDGIDFKNPDATYAVLNFEYSGLDLSSKTAKNAADFLSARLFIDKKLSIIDRSMVRAAIKKYEITSQGRLSKEEISKLASELNADYLVLGSLVSVGSTENYYEPGAITLSLTIRFIETGSGKVVAIASRQMSKKGNITKNLEELIRKIVDSI